MEDIEKQSAGDGSGSTDLFAFAGKAVGKPFKDKNGNTIGKIVNTRINGNQVIATIDLFRGASLEACIFSPANVKGDSRPPEGERGNETAQSKEGGTPTQNRLVRIFHFIVDDVPLVGWVMIVALLIAAAAWTWVTL